MTRQLIILVLVLTVNISSYGQNRTVNKDESLNSTLIKVDTSLFSVLPFDTAQSWLFKDSKPVELTNADLAQIEKLLKECIDKYNPGQVKLYNKIKKKNPNLKIGLENFIIDLAKYKRQYIAETNNKGEKEVWVNCGCDWPKYWRKEFYNVEDGGNCYFKLTINLTLRKYYNLEVNGDDSMPYENAP